MAANHITAQADFSAGELDPDIKRDDASPVLLAGCRQCSNMRLTNRKKASNRSGRRALFVQAGRTDEILVAPGTAFKFSFTGGGGLKIRNASDTTVSTQADGTYAWATATVSQIVWAVVPRSANETDVVICFPGQKPKIARYSISAGTWSFLDFAFATLGTGGSAQPLYRLAPAGMTLTPSGSNGAITVTTSAAYWDASMVGNIVTWLGKQIQLTGFTSTTVMTALVLEQLPFTNSMTSSSVNGVFYPGEIVSGNTAGTKAEVVSFNAGSGIMVLNSLRVGFDIGGGEIVTGPNGTYRGSGASRVNPAATLQWDEGAINASRGWPKSCFFDQGRLGFCNLPAVPNGIAWSEFGVYDNFLVGAEATDAIFEIVPNKSQVLFVVPGPESSEFVFCDDRIYYIPISTANPLQPGSVEFRTISQAGCGAAQPRQVKETIVYIDAGGTAIMSVVAPGAYYRPYETRELTTFHSHLLSSPVAIAAPTNSDVFPEQYVYVLNDDGTIAVGKYEVEGGQIKGLVGWVPHSNGAVQWVSALGSDVLYTTAYTPNGIAAVTVCEILDNTQYLDAAILYNSAPAALTTVGKGPLYFIAGGSVDLLDATYRMMGTYQIDANGYLVPQNNGGEDLTSVTLMAGQAWTATFEPFITSPAPSPGRNERMEKRAVVEAVAHVTRSTGFLWRLLYSGPLGANLPSNETTMKQRRVPAWNQGDDPTQVPKLREQAFQWRPSGRYYDPRVAIIKDTPGPLTVLEFGTETTG